MKPLLTVKDLRTNLFSQSRKIHAVRGVSFDLKAGETLGIVGESGCGKSVMAKTLTRLLPGLTAEIESGKIFYKGENLLQKTEKEMRSIRGKEISMIFQDPMTSLNPTMKIGKQIGEGYHLHYPKTTQEEVYTRVTEFLHQVGIPQPEACYNQYPHELSGGMRQRIMIAIAIIAKPHILIADEPTTSLDVTIQAQILDLLKTIQTKESMSVILITHDFSIVSNFCDRVAVMYAGEIIEIAHVNHLFKFPKHPYTQSLLHAIPRLDTPMDEALHMIPGSPPDLALSLSSCSFANRCAHEKEKCRMRKPQQVFIEEGHYTSCWLYKEKKSLKK